MSCQNHLALTYYKLIDRERQDDYYIINLIVDIGIVMIIITKDNCADRYIKVSKNIWMHNEVNN